MTECDETIIATSTIATNVTSTACYILHTDLSVIMLLLIITITICYHDAKQKSTRKNGK